MQYALLMKPHTNARYQQSLQKLAAIELTCILSSWGLSDKPCWRDIGGTPFLTFHAGDLTSAAWRAISGHSALCFAAIVEGGLLRPVALTGQRYLPEDVAEVLKYKGKTNADFTAMMLHCAQAASDFARSQQPLTVLDPLCGRGTTLFCALGEGHHAMGVDVDPKAIQEADAYFSRYLKYHKMKHQRKLASATLPKGKSAPEIAYAFAATQEAYKQGQVLSLRLFTGDTRQADAMMGKDQCHCVIGDLPYGVQHAPKEAQGLSTLQGLLDGALPAYGRALKAGGAIALSFNAYTLPREQVCQAMERAGLNVLSQHPFQDFSHWVEQAVQRDVVIARKEPPASLQL